MGIMFAHALVKDNIVAKENLLLLEKSEDRKADIEKLNVGQVVEDTDSRISETNTFIIAVKPQGFEAIAKDLKHLFKSAN